MRNVGVLNIYTKEVSTKILAKSILKTWTSQICLKACKITKYQLNHYRHITLAKQNSQATKNS